MPSGRTAGGGDGREATHAEEVWEEELLEAFGEENRTHIARTKMTTAGADSFSMTRILLSIQHSSAASERTRICPLIASWCIVQYNVNSPSLWTVKG